MTSTWNNMSLKLKNDPQFYSTGIHAKHKRKGYCQSSVRNLPTILNLPCRFQSTSANCSTFLIFWPFQIRIIEGYCSGNTPLRRGFRPLRRRPSWPCTWHALLLPEVTTWALSIPTAHHRSLLIECPRISDPSVTVIKCMQCKLEYRGNKDKGNKQTINFKGRQEEIEGDGGCAIN